MSTVCNICGGSGSVIGYASEERRECGGCHGRGVTFPTAQQEAEAPSILAEAQARRLAYLDSIKPKPDDLASSRAEGMEPGTVENFAGYPKQLSEVRSKTDGTKWKPRDVLIQMLREIDEGTLKPDTLVVCYIIDEPGNGCLGGHVWASERTRDVLAALDYAKHDFLNAD